MKTTPDYDFSFTIRLGQVLQTVRDVVASPEHIPIGDLTGDNQLRALFLAAHQAGSRYEMIKLVRTNPDFFRTWATNLRRIASGPLGRIEVGGDWTYGKFLNSDNLNALAESVETSLALMQSVPSMELTPPTAISARLLGYQSVVVPKADTTAGFAARRRNFMYW